MKRTVAIIVCLVMLVFVGAGCSQTAEPTKAPSSTPIPTQAAPVELVMERPLWGDGNPDSDYSKAIQAAIEKAINIKVTIVGESNPSDQWQKPNLMLAAGETLDIFQVPTDNVKGWRKYVKDGVVISLNDLLDSNGPDMKAKVDSNAWVMNTDSDGKIWALPDEQPGNAYGIYIRQDWLDTAGLKAPTTIDECETVMAAFKSQFNDVGFVPLWPDAQADVFLGAFVEHISPYKDESGKIQPVWFQAGYKDYLSKMADWYKKGYLNKEISTMDYTTASNLMWAGQTGIMLNWLSKYGLKYNEDLIIKNVPTAKISPMSPLSGKYTGKILGLSPCSADVMITASCKNPQAAMTFLNWSMATKEGWTLCKYGIEGTDYTVVDASKGLIKLSDSPHYAIYCSTRLNTMQGTLFTDLGSIDSQKFYDDTTKYPVQYPLMLGFVPDQLKIQPLQDKLQPLDQKLNELRQKIIMGEEPVSKWDDMVKSYMDNGGRAYYDELTTEFVK